MAAPPGSRTDVHREVVGPFEENTWFLRRKGGDEVVVIDPGDEAERLAAVIEGSGWKPVAIVNTHAHLDHVGAVAALRDRYRIPFALHPADVPTFRWAPIAAELYGVPPVEVCDVDRPLAGGETLDLAGLEIRVVLTPGHTPGHVSLLCDGRVFGGDCLFQGSIGRTDLPGGDTVTLMRTLEETFLALPDATIVHSGHGPDTTIGRERATNPFLADLGQNRL